MTPSFRQSSWLRLCVASVADQEGIEHEHLVQDACSDDSTQDWLAGDSRVRAFIEKDEGMYDAVNRGFRRASGEVVAYLNCDEQYLPGALRAVGEVFASRPEVDIVIADSLVVDETGGYLCHRIAMKPIRWHLAHRWTVPTAALFMRRRVFAEQGLWFDPKWRALGDFIWIEEACRRGLRWAELRHFTSTFTETGTNLGLSPKAVEEFQRIEARIPPWQITARPLIRTHHRIRMLMRGAFTQRPFSYRIYTQHSPAERREFRVEHPTPLWHTRLSAPT